MQGICVYLYCRIAVDRQWFVAIIRETADRKVFRHWFFLKKKPFWSSWIRHKMSENYISLKLWQSLSSSRNDPPFKKTIYRRVSVSLLLNLILINLIPFNPTYLMSVRDITLLIMRWDLCLLSSRFSLCNLTKPFYVFLNSPCLPKARPYHKQFFDLVVQIYNEE